VSTDLGIGNSVRVKVYVISDVGTRGSYVCKESTNMINRPSIDE